MHTVIGPTANVGLVAVKSLLLYSTAVAGLRLGHRRTLAEMSAFDFVAAVVVGAIVGRVPNASDAGYLAGAATLVSVLAAHRLVTRLRRMPALSQVIDHPPMLLVAEGRVLDDSLRRSGLTTADLNGLLRERGVRSLADVDYVVFEQRGRLSVLSRRDPPAEQGSDLLRDVVNASPGRQ